MRAVSGSSVLHRLASSVLGPRPLTPASLWAAHGRRALSAEFCVTAPLALFVALGRPDLGAAAALGGFTAVYGHALPYRRRAGVSAGVGVVLVSAVVLGGGARAPALPPPPVPGPPGAAVVLGGIAGPQPFLLALVLGLLGAAATAATAIWSIGPPGPLMAVLVGGSASALGADAGLIGEHAAAAAGSATLSWLVVMAAWVWDPAGPERRAVGAAEAAVGAAEGSPSGRPDPVARAVRVAHVAVAGGSRRRPSLRPRLEQGDSPVLRSLPPPDPPLPAPAPDTS